MPHQDIRHNLRGLNKTYGYSEYCRDLEKFCFDFVKGKHDEKHNKQGQSETRTISENYRVNEEDPKSRETEIRNPIHSSNATTFPQWYRMLRDGGYIV